MERLAAWPAALRALEGAGQPLAPLPGEEAETRDNRLATALMSLFRDTRDEECFEALYAFTRPSVMQWIQSLTSRGLRHLDAAELLQDTFVNVYRYPNGFRDEHAGSFRVWVRTIAGNIIRRACSSRRRFSFQELPEGMQEPEDQEADPLRRALADEERASLGVAWVLFLCHYARAWSELAQRDRRTLHLVEVEGLSYLEAGEILKVGRSNMKMIVFRSRKRIARHMRSAMAGAAAGELGAA